MSERIVEKLYQDAAERLWQAEMSGQPCAPVRDMVEGRDIAAAYAIQKLNTDRKLSNGSHVSGRKIGLTSRAVQEQQGVFEPDFGTLMTDMEIGHNTEVSLADCMSPRAELEIALVMGCDVDGPNMTMPSLVRAIDYACASIEIVESRIRDWDISIVDTIADNAAAGKYVLGSQFNRIDGFDLAAARVELRRNGTALGQGTGAASLGHPLNAALWLARTLAERGEALREGDVVLTGALIAMVPPIAGDTFTGEIEGLGSATVTFVD